MSVTPSRRHVNWSSVVFTPLTGSAVTFTGVQNVQYDERGSIITHSGDADRYPTTKVQDFADPQVTVTARDLTSIRGLIDGDRGALAATHLDAKNVAAVGGGGYTLTLAGAIIATKTGGGQHRQFGEGAVTFESESVDGTTNPLTFAAL